MWDVSHILDFLEPVTSLLQLAGITQPEGSINKEPNAAGACLQRRLYRHPTG